MAMSTIILAKVRDPLQGPKGQIVFARPCHSERMSRSNVILSEAKNPMPIDGDPSPIGVNFRVRATMSF